MNHAANAPDRAQFKALTLAALGVVFGDIGTSPLYAIREVFASPHHPLPITPDNVLDADPRRRTLCGAPASDRDLDHRSGVRAAVKGDGELCSRCASLAGAEAVAS